MEELPDRQAADAVRGRIDCKDLLGLDLADPGFDASALCEFRKRLVEGSAEHLLCDTLLDVCKQQGWLKARGQQRTDSTHVLAKVRAINRLMCVGETMRFALNSLAVAAPEWLLPRAMPSGSNETAIASRKAVCLNRRGIVWPWPNRLEQTAGHLLTAVFDPLAPIWLRELPAIQVLRRVWVQNYFFEEDEHLR